MGKNIESDDIKGVTLVELHRTHEIFSDARTFNIDEKGKTYRFFFVLGVSLKPKNQYMRYMAVLV